MAVGSKPLAALCDEVLQDASSLTLSDGSLLRTVRVVNAAIASEDGHRTLVLASESRPNEKQPKQVNQPLSKKLPAGAEIEGTIASALAEDLSIEGFQLADATVQRDTMRTLVAPKTTSGAFPGLACRFEVVEVDAIVTGGKLPQMAFTTTRTGAGGQMRVLQWTWLPHLTLPPALGGRLRAHDFS